MPSVSPSVSPEQQRLDQQAYLQHALAVSVIGVWHVDIATGAQWWSPETYQLFGVDPATPLRVDDFYARVHPDDHERVRAATARAIDTGSVYDVEHRIVTPLGLVEVGARARHASSAPPTARRRGSSASSATSATRGWPRRPCARAAAACRPSSRTCRS